MRGAVEMPAARMDEAEHGQTAMVPDSRWSEVQERHRRGKLTSDDIAWLIARAWSLEGEVIQADPC